MEEVNFLVGKTIQPSGVVSNEDTGDTEFVMHFTDGDHSRYWCMSKGGLSDGGGRCYKDVRCFAQRKFHTKVRIAENINL